MIAAFLRLSMRVNSKLLGAAAVLSLAAAATAQPAPRVEDRVGQIPQSAPSTPWAFIGYGITTPATTEWFVADSTPRGGTLGRYLSTTEAHSAVLVLSSEVLDAPVETDAALLDRA